MQLTFYIEKWDIRQKILKGEKKMSNAIVKDNKMAVMPVNRLMINMGVPMIISMMLQAVYNIVDSAFVANMKDSGEMALNALTLAFPIQMLMVAIGMIYTLIIMLAGFVGLQIFAEPFSSLFGLSGETKSLCVSAMRIISVSYVFAGANIAFQGVFQALESGMESFVVSVCRQFLFVVPVAYIFSEMVLSGMCKSYFVWISFVIAEMLSVIVSLVFMKRVNKRTIRN